MYSSWEFCVFSGVSGVPGMVREAWMFVLSFVGLESYGELCVNLDF